MNMRKAIPLLVIASMMLSILPSAFFANAVLGVPTVTAITAGATGLNGQTYSVTGAASTVAAGATVQLYWDDTTIAWDGAKGLLNSTTAAANGSYEVRFKVPEATNGNHYLWVKVPSTNELQTPAAAFVVNEKVSLSATSGLQGDQPVVTVYGYKGTADIQLFFLAAAQGAHPAYTNAAGTGMTFSGDGATETFTGTVASLPVDAGTFTVTPPIVADTMVDDGVGGLSSAAGGTGTINYITGEFSVTFNAAPAVGVGNIAVAYMYYPTTAGQVYPLNKGVTNSVGTYTATLTVPAGALAGADKISAVDEVSNAAQAVFTIGPVITASTTVTTVGTVVTIQGRGWNPAKFIGAVNPTTLTRPGFSAICAIQDLPAGGIDIDGAGRFRMDIIIPQGDSVNDDYTITVTTDDALPANRQTATITGFEITELASVSVTPSYGPQGSTITVSGTSYTKVAGTDVTVELLNAAGAPLVPAVVLGTADTLSDGTFSTTFSVPAQVDNSYRIAAYITAHNIADTVGFRIGSMYINLSASSGPVGKAITITGSGFSSPGQWNATIGEEDLQTTIAVGGSGLISQLVYIPDMAPGNYTVTVWDVTADIKLTTTFRVTAGTVLTLTPTSATNTFNVSVSGSGFKGAAGTTINFVLFNKTSTGATDRSWAMNVLTNYVPPAAPIAAVVNGTGQVRAYWNVPNSATLSKGNYFVNATDADGYFAQAAFTVSAVHAVATPRKASFAQGETISFILQHSFGGVAGSDADNSYLRIYDPSTALVFVGDAMPDTDWIQTGDYYTLPYSAQHAAGNPMVLDSDAPLGTWTYRWYDAADDLITSGNFTVTAVTGGTTDEQIAALAAQITAVTTTVNNLSTTVATVATTATAASNAATAASAAASQAATAAQAASQAALDASAKSDAAKTAADNAAAAANGLTTLVYAAIGASLIAALAAIVALMQISRKIA